MPELEGVRLAGPAFALAVSPDETRLAGGGAAGIPVTVWDLAGPTCLAELAGLPRQTHALAFSPDGARLAAANLWGGLAVWSLPEGRLLNSKPDNTGRATRSLTYPAHRPAAPRPVMLSDSIFRGVRRSLSPSGRFVAVSQAGVRVLPYRSTTVTAELDLSAVPLAQSGVRQLAWSTDSQWLALAGEGWAGAWRPFDSPAAVYALPLPFAEAPHAVAMLGRARQVLVTHGAQILALELPAAPVAPTLTPWQQFLQRVPPPSDPAFNPRHDWHWNITDHGYEGVDTLGAGLLWYAHSHNPHAGGAALDQDFAGFLESGPALPAPDAVLMELVQAVRALV